MIDLLTVKELREIAAIEASHCVSLYLPTHRAGPDVQQDPTRLKNLLALAGAELDSLGLRREQVAAALAPATALLADDVFWAHGESGLAVLLSPDAMRTFHLSDPPEELVVVSERFHVKPLLRSVSTGEAFWILAISQNKVRLLRGARTGASEVALGEIPESLATALWFEDRERQLQSHGASRVGSGRVSATFHGQGLGKDTQHAELARFLRAVDGGVAEVVGPSDPIVLAGVERDLTAFREVSRSREIVAESVTGNCEHRSPAELHQSAWPLVAGRFDAGRIRVQDAIRSGGDRAVTDLDAVYRAAREGRVEALLVALGVQVWGVIDGEAAAVVPHDLHMPGDRDLLDAVAIEIMGHGGDVHAVEPRDVPGEGPLAALLRW